LGLNELRYPWISKRMEDSMKKILVVLLMIMTVASLWAGGKTEKSTEEGTVSTDSSMPLEGKKVTVFSTLTEGDFDACMKPFEERTGIDVIHEPTRDFESLITVRVEAGYPPDVAIFPQPGLLADFAADGIIMDLYEWIDKSYLEKQYNKTWLDMSTFNGELAGLWWRVSCKSLVWYPKKKFEAKGYKIPQTWDALIALSDQIVADGGTPWTIGLESGGATGWVATDWMEDIMLRTASPEKYDQWVAGELPFSSPEVKHAAELMGQIWLNPDYVYGGATGIVTTPFQNGADPLFTDPPKAWLHKQANFVVDFFPRKGDEMKTGDIDFFYFPPIDPKYGKPVLGQGEQLAAFNDRPEVREFMKYIATGESTKAWLEKGGFISPHNDASLDWYPTEASRKIAKMLLDADTVRFDASDLMPGAVGAGSFWSEMTEYVAGKDLDEALADIDKSWPR
jgi:alpha-glucoside transport system substrate-binding protein